MMKCPFCQTPIFDPHEVPHRFFRHLDFSEAADGGRFGTCSDCGLITNELKRTDQRKAIQGMTGHAYAASRQTRHAVGHGGSEKPMTRVFLQAKALAEMTVGTRPAVLDIGCFDGLLLRELARHWPQGTFHGLDVNPHLKSLFPARPNFRLWLGRLEEVDYRYDLIVASHSIMYILELDRLFESVSLRLKPGGRFFLQTPDIYRNPCYLLMADQFHCYSRRVMTRVLARAGFRFEALEHPRFTREVAGWAIPDSTVRLVSGGQQDDLRTALNRLNHMDAALRGLDDDAPVGVLGTTINAAFCHSILEDRLAFFADENTAAPMFRGVPVIHPRKMDPNARLLIPYADSAESIKRRFSKQYPGVFITL